MSTEFQVVRPTDTAVRDAAGSRLDLALFVGLTAVLLFAPLAFGAVEPWSIFVMQMGAAALIALCAIRHLSTQSRFAASRLYWPVAAFGALLALQVTARSSAYQQVTRSGFLLYGAYFGLFFVAVQLFQRGEWLRRFVSVLVIYGFAVAVFAVAQALTSNGKLYWLRAPQYKAGIFGPYVNYNHYAGLMEMLTPMALVLAMDRSRAGGQRLLLAFIAVVMGGSIFLSHSRGGMIAFTAELVLLVAFTSVRRRDWQAGLVVGIVIVALVAGLVWLGGAPLGQRIATLETPTDPGVGGIHLAIVKDGMKMVPERPWLGWGLGTFPIVYPRFRSFFTDFFINEAHNDYLQVLVEMGVIGFIVVLWFLVEVYRGAISNLAERNSGAMLSMAVLLGCTGIVIHSFTDFNLHIPANAALFYVLCAAAARQPAETFNSRGSHGKLMYNQPNFDAGHS